MMKIYTFIYIYINYVAGFGPPYERDGWSCNKNNPTKKVIRQDRIGTCMRREVKRNQKMIQKKD